VTQPLRTAAQHSVAAEYGVNAICNGRPSGFGKLIVPQSQLLRKVLPTYIKSFLVSLGTWLLGWPAARCVVTWLIKVGGLRHA
jgi:hypothetical protein